MQPWLVAQSIVDGLLIGGVYALVAMGLNLMFGVMKIVNFAQGEFLMVGMYVAAGLGALVLPPGLLGVYWVAVPTTMILAAVGVAFYLLLLQRAARFGDTAQILMTIGVSIALQGAAQVWTGSGFRFLRSEVYGEAIRVGELTIPVAQAVAFVVAIVVTVAMAWVLRRTLWGKSVRAVAESSDMAQSLGVDTRRAFVTATAVAIGLAGLAGSLLAPYHYTFPQVGQSFVVVAFLAIVVAGLGNVVGAVWGGLAFGVVQSLTASFLSLGFSTAAMYVLFLAVLLLRPEGIFTGRSRSV